MDEAILYDLISPQTISKWRDEAEKGDCTFKTTMLKERDLLYEAVGENKRNLVNYYKLAIENYFDYIYYYVDIKLINICIKIGMELQKFYDRSEE